MKSNIRRLNERGLETFHEYLDDLSSNPKNGPPMGMLEDENYSEKLEVPIQIEQGNFETRFAMGRYLVDATSDLDIYNLVGDRGLWSWIALFWFDHICPPTSDGSRKPSRPYNYILSKRYNHRPRHAILTTYRLVHDYGDTAFFLLSKKPHERGELVEQLAARQYFISCKGVIEAANRLYHDPERKTFKVGSTSQSRGGNIRRFIVYLQQLDLTYDLFTLSGDAIVRMLPDEYSGFLSA
jgi:hypothetical protein